MKRIVIIFLALIAMMCISCDIIPAEEPVEENGATVFVASFQVPAGTNAMWNGSEKLIVVDSYDKTHKFSLDVGTGTSEGEFSGDITPGSVVKYVAYSSNPNMIQYDIESSAFTMDIPSVYTAKSAGTLVTANNAAIGILEGSGVELVSACGFIKFTLEHNGQKITQGGVSYPLTDVSKVTIKANDGLRLCGKVKARWSEETKTVSFESVSDGASSITFNSRSFKTPEGNIVYEAGDYYLPVVPQNYEDISIMVEDGEGNKATAVSKRALNVQTALTSNLSTISWPTVVIEVNLKCSTMTESAEKHPDINKWPKYNYEVDRVSETTGEVIKGEAMRYTVIPFRESGLDFQAWASEGYAKYHVSSVIYDIIFNNYYTGWKNSGDLWTGGSKHGYAWIKVPEFNGVLYKMDVQVLSRSEGPVHIATSVNEETGAPEDIIYTIEKTPKNAFSVFSIPIALNKANIPYYIVFGDGYYYRCRSWKLYYKVYE